MLGVFYEAGIINHINKPFKKKDLIEIVSQNLKINKNGLSQDKNNISVMTRKLNEIREDFSEEFFLSFVNDSLVEIDRLWADLEKSFDIKDIQASYQYAHDLSGVSGNIGMENTYLLAKDIENLASSGDFKNLSDLIGSLKTQLVIEKEAVTAYLAKKTQ
jgi:HPt (histidine-containing phosphotransfer) domain-containing protein